MVDVGLTSILLAVPEIPFGELDVGVDLGSETVIVSGEIQIILFYYTIRKYILDKSEETTKKTTQKV